MVLLEVARFQFPLHRDPRCNDSNTPNRVMEMVSFSSLYIGILAATKSFQFSFSNSQVSVPFTSGSSLQREYHVTKHKQALSFSSLYIGILAATYPAPFQALKPAVSVPFTSGSSLQPRPYVRYTKPAIVSVPFTSGSSLQLQRLLPCTKPIEFQFPLHRDPRCNRH